MWGKEGKAQRKATVISATAQCEERWYWWQLLTAGSQVTELITKFD